MGFIISTDFGEVEITPQAGALDIEKLSMHPGIGEFSDYRSLITSTAALTAQAEAEQATLALASHQEQIVGYAVLRPPQPGERWQEMPIMRELFCEVARSRRGGQIIKNLLSCLHHQPQQEEQILYLVGYSWHWDLSGSGKSVTQYRQSLIHLVQGLGYKEYPTNEPNVGLRTENLFMARLGANLDASHKRAFSRLLFGISDNW